jgi:hypothetical protein
MELIQKQIAFETDAFETVARFCDEIKKSDGVDFKEAFRYTQLTWRTNKVSPHAIFPILKERIVGKIHLKPLKTISEMCMVFEIKTGAGKYTCKVIKEKEPYKPSIHGQWGVNPLSFRENEK